MAINEIVIPDIGTTEEVDVIEVLVKPGDHVRQEDGLITLESDKASMEVPAPLAGTVKEVKVNVGDKVVEGALIVTLETDVKAEPVKAEPAKKEQAPASTSESSSEVEITIPDIGGAEGVEVIELSVGVGDQVKEEDALITLESDKATMEVPSPHSGTIKSISVKLGDKVSEGSVIAVMTTQATVEAVKVEPKKAEAPKPATAPAKSVSSTPEASAVDSSLHASPVVRRIASEFGVNLNNVNPTGDKGRITKEDVQNFVKNSLASGGAVSGGAGIPAMPVVDFSKFGDIETIALNKIQKLTGEAMSRNWLNIPHVTQFDEADITEMEAFRQQNKKQAEKQGVKLTPLVFVMKALVAALQKFPRFNSSLSADGGSLVMKKYFNIGVAVDTPNGLVVPVVRDVDQKGVFALAKELGEISVKARDGKLMPKDMQGGSMTISSLGGIGGTAFTPIVNAPEVAILGVSKAQMKPQFQNGEFVPRLMCPLALSYDHRVIDGADGARFATYLSLVLSDLRQIIL